MTLFTTKLNDLLFGIIRRESLRPNETERLHVRKDGRVVALPTPMICSLYDRADVRVTK